MLDAPLEQRRGGGATGTGAATIRALAGAGATVVISHHAQIQQARAVLDAVRRTGSDGVEVSCDLTNPAEVDLMMKQAASELGPVDILVNNAGTYPRTPWHATVEDAWARALDVNLSIHYRATRAVTPSMISRQWGRIVNVSSVNARAGRPGLTAYSAAKVGLIGLTRSLARELGPHGICVNTVLPGAIQVDAENALPAPDRPRPQEQIARQCVPRRGPPGGGRADPVQVGDSWVGMVRPGPDLWAPHGHPVYLRACVEASLRRLNTERLDLCYLHRIDPEVPLDDQLATLLALQNEGKIGAIGLSKVTTHDIRLAAKTITVAAVQNVLNTTDRNDPALELCRDRAIPYVPYRPLDAGILARTHGVLAPLDWLLRLGPHAAPIPGTSRPEHLAEIVASVTGESP
ncbi:SDR family NAD(P)-dependent oxidoreductase [Streptomyces sp. NPDC048491]|uniref:SDR family NAD(P)-dependent oxidoreductase n=1 Tax=Streptomyces sp. NPDC048491 TaxID=3157207 RepID=UPI003440925C